MEMPAGGLRELRRITGQEIQRVQKLFPIYESGVFDGGQLGLLTGVILLSMYVFTSSEHFSSK